MMQVYRQGRLTGFKANNGKIYSIKKYGMKGAISKASKAELIRPMTYNQILKQRLPKQKKTSGYKRLYNKVQVAYPGFKLGRRKSDEEIP